MAPPPTPDHLLLVVLFVAFTSTFASASSFGINYGLVANNLPSPSSVPPLLRSIGVSRVRLYDADPPVLRAFAGTGVELVIGIPDKCIVKLSCESNAAEIWVKYNVLPYLPATKIRAVTVGNEVLTGNDTAAARHLIPAMQAVHSALAALNLDKQIVVTTAHSLAILKTSYPPSAACFRRKLAKPLAQLHSFLGKTSSPFLINAYPYFAYQKDPKGVPLEFAIFQPSPGLHDPKTGLHYDNMFHAQVDAIYAALDALVGPSRSKSVKVRVSETGWPSHGDKEEHGATVENACKYNSNLIKLVEQRKGTPRRPDEPLDVYVFALFNENLKPGPLSERNYGLFKPDMTPVYQLFGSQHKASGSHSPARNGSISVGGNEEGSPDGLNLSGGYFSTSPATRKVQLDFLLAFIACSWTILHVIRSGWLF